MMPSPSQMQDMQAQLDRLNAAQNEALAKVDNFWASLGANFIDPQNTGVRANQYLLQTTQASIVQLSTTEWLEVCSGTRSVENWSAHAKRTYQTIQGVVPGMDDWTFGGVLSATGSATAETVKSGALTGLAIATPILLLVGGLYVFILIGPMLRRG